MSYVPYTFGGQTGPIPLSELDANFANVKASSYTAETVTGNAQANITSIGTLTSLSVSGNIDTGNVNVTTLNASGSLSAVGNISTSGNINTTGKISAAGNVTANIFIGNVSFGNGVVSGTGNITGGNLYLTGDGVIVGNLIVQGTTTSAHSNTVNTSNLFITVGDNQSSGALLNGAGILVGNSNIATWRYNYATSSWQSNIGITPSSNAIVSLGGPNNYWGPAYVGSLNTLGSISAGNITTPNYGIISTGNVNAGNVTTVNNISSGNLSTGNITVSSNVVANGRITGSNLISNGSISGTTLSVTGNVATVGISASGTITGAAFNGPGSNLTGIAANLTVGNAANAINLTTANFSIKEVSGKLYFYYHNTQIASLDLNGNFTSLANVTGFGAP
jgi:hypothetical protein